MMHLLGRLLTGRVAGKAAGGHLSCLHGAGLLTPTAIAMNAHQMPARFMRLVALGAWTLSARLSPSPTPCPQLNHP